MPRRTQKVLRAAMGVAALWWGSHVGHATHPDHRAARPEITWPSLPGGVLAPPAARTVTPFPHRIVADLTLPRGQVLVQSPDVEGVAYGPPGAAWWSEPPAPAVLAWGTAKVPRSRWEDVSISTCA
jgi:hypothetical protein